MAQTSPHSSSDRRSDPSSPVSRSASSASSRSAPSARDASTALPERAAPVASGHSQRRRHRRVRSGVGVRISTIEPERDPWTGRPFFRSLQETCTNVSRGGAFVQTDEPLDPGRRILVEIQLPTGRPLEAIGRIAWVKRVINPHSSESESGIGIEFLGGASDHFSALDDYVSQRASDPNDGE